MSVKNISKICRESLNQSKAIDILFLDIEKISSFADRLVIATASSNIHAKSVSDKLVESLKKNDIKIIGVEGQSDSGWILVDCGDLVINIMKKDIREFYDLESLWGTSSN